MGKYVKPKEIYYTCDVCQQSFHGQSKDQLREIKYRQFFTKFELGEIRVKHDNKKFMICDKCFDMMKNYICQKVRQDNGDLYKHNPHYYR